MDRITKLRLALATKILVVRYKNKNDLINSDRLQTYVYYLLESANT